MIDSKTLNELVKVMIQMAENHLSLRNEVTALIRVLEAHRLVSPADDLDHLKQVEAFLGQDQLLARLRTFQGTLQ